MQVVNSFQEMTGQPQCVTPSFNASGSVLDKYASYMDIPGISEKVERMQELKDQFITAREVARSLGGDATSDNPFLK